MDNKQTILITLCGLAALTVSAGTRAAGAEEKPAPIVIGAATEAVLGMQREGAFAGQLQPISGEVAARSYQRYLESFTHQIPQFNKDSDSTLKSAGSGSR
jgi:hypothetical protein